MDDGSGRFPHARPRARPHVGVDVHGRPPEPRPQDGDASPPCVQVTSTPRGSTYRREGRRAEGLTGPLTRGLERLCTGPTRVV